MKQILRERLPEHHLPGRIIQKAVGKDAFSVSGAMTMGFARYSAESGPMEPHHHAEEVVYIIDAKDGWVRCGTAKDQLGQRIRLEAGMTLHFPELEWHVFEYDEGGHVDIIFIYGQVDNIRPEEIQKSG
jgi:hypothetical protein